MSVTRIKGLLGVLLLTALLPAAVAQTFTEPASPFGESRFLPVEQAFAYQISIDSDRQLTVTWQIAPGYYMYQDKFRFVATVAPEAYQPETAVDEPAERHGTNAMQPLQHTFTEAIAHSDEFFGDVMIHRDRAIATISLPATLPETFTLQLEYQGCADEGLCYPLQRDEVPILL